jgi:hypothetical protein
MVGLICLIFHVVSLLVGIYLAIIGHWMIGLLFVVTSQAIHFVIEKTTHALMRLYERRSFYSLGEDDRRRVEGRIELAETFSEPSLMPDEIKKMVADHYAIGKIGGIAYIGIMSVLIYLVVAWSKAN